jgi:hypothetical protein
MRPIILKGMTEDVAAFGALLLFLGESSGGLTRCIVFEVASQ